MPVAGAPVESGATTYLAWMVSQTKVLPSSESGRMASTELMTPASVRRAAPSAGPFGAPGLPGILGAVARSRAPTCPKGAAGLPLNDPVTARKLWKAGVAKVLSTPLSDAIALAGLEIVVGPVASLLQAAIASRSAAAPVIRVLSIRMVLFRWWCLAGSQTLSIQHGQAAAR